MSRDYWNESTTSGALLYVMLYRFNNSCKDNHSLFCISGLN